MAFLVFEEAQEVAGIRKPTRPLRVPSPSVPLPRERDAVAQPGVGEGLAGNYCPLNKLLNLAKGKFTIIPLW